MGGTWSLKMGNGWLDGLLKPPYIGKTVFTNSTSFEGDDLIGIAAKRAG
jgi:hypothetical protein